jgi:hypothetical protein
MPRVDLADASWTVWSGQALWRPGADRQPLAGDVLLARHANGDVLVNFSKSPLSIFTAQTAGAAWRIDFIEEGRSYSGRGRPPGRFVWLYLPDILAGAPPPRSWAVESEGGDEWQLARARTGETIRLILDR